MIKTLTIYLFTLLTFSTFAQNNYGIYFKAKEVGKQSRTGIDVTTNGLIEYENSFNIKFDVSFRSKPMRYGHIFRFKEYSGNNVIDFICKLDDDQPSIIIVLNKKEQLINLKLPTQIRYSNNYWHHIDVHFNQNKIELSFNEYKAKAEVNLPSSAEYALIFGIIDNYNLEPVEVPPMSIKDLKIYSNEVLNYHWTFDQFYGENSVDKIRKKKIELRNPDWEVYHHSKWKKEANLNINSVNFPQITFNKHDEKFYILPSGNELLKYDINSNNIESISYSGYPVYEEAQQLGVDSEGKLYSYSFYSGGCVKYDDINNQWSNTNELKIKLPKFWYHNRLINPITNQLTIINGYGFFTFKNSIQTYNPETKYWSNDHFEGDTIHPRYHSSFGKAISENNYLLFGGMGSESGKQILGVNFYYDLYRLNFETKSIKKEWSVTGIDGIEDYVPINNLIVNKENECFYTLMHAQENYETHLRLIKGALNKPEINWIGDSIPYLFKDTESYADVFFLESRNSLLTYTIHKVNNEKYEFNLYSLKYPPVEPLQLVGHNNITPYKTIILSLIIVLISIIVFWYYKKRVKQKTKIIADSIAIQTEIKESTELKITENSIYLFGGFQVFDKNKNDITYRFSPTLKDLFLLILLNTYEKEKGISSFKIQEYLWPNKSELSAKNNRGVNIKKLREIIDDIKGINLEFDNKYWRLNINENVFCDYSHVLDQIYSHTDNSNLHVNIEELTNILKRGNYLPNTSALWLDQSKSKVTQAVVEFFEHQSNCYLALNNTSKTIELSNIILNFDSLNEAALKNKIKSLSLQGQHSIAMETYNNFRKQYNEMYGEEFSIPLNKLVK